MNLFGKKKTAAPPNTIETIQKLNEQYEMLERRSLYVEKRRDEARNQAKEKLKRKDKRSAAALLKRSKQYENELAKLDGQKANIDTLKITLEGAQTNLSTVNAMKSASTALNSINLANEVGKVDDIMESVNDSIGMANEVAEAVAQPIGPVMDDDDIAKELEEMESEMVDEQFVEAPVVPTKAEIAKEISKQAATTVSTPAASVSVSSASAAPSRPVVTVSASSSSSSSSSSSKEQEELEQLDALMNA